MNILIDTNVALDLLQKREPYVGDAVRIFALAEAEQINLLLSSDAISTIFYIVEKNKDSATAREAIAKLLDFVHLAQLDEKTVLKAMGYEFTDIEDALVAAVAQDCGAQIIVTRNVRDFKSSPVDVMTPHEFLAYWFTKRHLENQDDQS